MEYMPKLLEDYDIGANKMDMVLFPHRIAPEKQVEIFRDLGKEFPDVEFIVAQDKVLTKEEYHLLLMRSKIVFSANLQETLGIGCYEGALVGAVPMVPDRLSYSEMYLNDFKYPSEWTESWESYLENKQDVVEFIHNLLGSDLREKCQEQEDMLNEEFFGGTALYNIIRGKK
tara:strand:- start:2245 stop:2760 length:516 start_codon:yes stop_codon:yes gene_type:complete